MRYLKTFVVLLFLVACDSPKTIPNDDLANIFHDALLTNAYISQKSVKYDSLNIYEPILAKYGYTKEDMQYTLENFLRQKSAHLSDVITDVNDRLAREAAALRAAVVRVDTVRNVAQRKARRTIFELEKPIVARARLTPPSSSSSSLCRVLASTSSRRAIPSTPRMRAQAAASPPTFWRATASPTTSMPPLCTVSTAPSCVRSSR